MSPEKFGLAFDHLGLATQNPGKAIAFLSGLGYAVAESIYDPLQKVNLVMCTSDQMPAVEVISPADEPGPLSAVLAGRSETFYHMCYRSRDLAASLLAMKESGLRLALVVPPKPAVLFGGKPVSFHMIRGFGMIEIIEI